ncbi:hypothetical protein NGB36_11760 [Streptomyces sp. RB6PN25]|uniref:Uncharacterized protein n=1 Tax=Streptomyces humicola TaxID=2953240 RepID=A0ABT1PUA5_9ACTN|nr:hypothetical protein [Streptomyces humicola]MCQ4081257.1 hypothetical protein [Streptomyces humicola]
MLTIHAASFVLPFGGAEPLSDGAVVIDGDRIAGFGSYEHVVSEWPSARVRRWPGVLTPGLVNRFGPELLEAAYHPDPREADALGERPLMGEELTALALTDARWGESARRGLQRMLRHGTTAVAGPFSRATVRAAVARSGLVVVARTAAPQGTPDPDPLTGGVDPAAVVTGPLVAGGHADLAAFDVLVSGDPYASLAERGAGSCAATVLAGRLAFRRS